MPATPRVIAIEASPSPAAISLMKRGSVLSSFLHRSPFHVRSPGLSCGEKYAYFSRKFDVVRGRARPRRAILATRSPLLRLKVAEENTT